MARAGAEPAADQTGLGVPAGAVVVIRVDLDVTEHKLGIHARALVADPRQAHSLAFVQKSAGIPRVFTLIRPPRMIRSATVAGSVVGPAG